MNKQRVNYSERSKKKWVRVEEPVEIFIDGKNVIVAKYTPVCILCGSVLQDTEIKNICMIVEK